MRLLFHQTRKDARRLRWLLALWVVVLALHTAVIATAGVAAEGWMAPVVHQLLTGFFALAQMVLVVVMVPLLVHEEPLVGTTAAWLTRPLSRRLLLASKALFMLFVLILPPTVLEVAVLAANDATPWQLAQAGAEVLLRKGSLVAFAAALASLTPTFARFIVWGAVLWMVEGMASAGLMMQRMFSPTADIWSWAQSEGLRASLLLTLGGGLVTGAAVVAHQYLTRRTRRSVAMGLAGVVSCVLLSAYSSRVVPRARAAGGPAARQVQLSIKADSVFARDAVSFRATADRRTALSAEAECVELAPGTFCDVDELSGVLKYPDGTEVRVEKPNGPSLGRVHGPALEHALGGAHVVNIVLDTADLFEVDKATFAQRGQTPALFEGRGAVSLKKYRVRASLPLRRGASESDGVDRVTITDVLRAPGSVQVLLLKRKLELALSSDTSKLPGLAGTLFGSASYALVNAERKQAFIPEFQPAFDLTDAFAMMLPEGQRLAHHPVSLTFKSDARFERRPPLDESWLAGASLAVIEAEVEEHATASFSVPGFVLAKNDLGLAGPTAPALAPDLTAAQYYERGAMHLEDALGDPPDQRRSLGQAKAYLDRAVEVDPALGPAHIALALVAAVEGDSPASRRAAAKPSLEKARAFVPSDAGLGRVEAYLADAEGGDAAAAMERVVAAAPAVAAFWRDLGHFRGKSHHVTKSMEAYDKALATRPAAVEAARVQAQRAQTYAYVDRPALAAPAFAQAAALRPDFTAYWVRLCDVRLASGDYRRARDAGRRAVALEPSGWTKSCLLRAQACLGEIDEASEDVQKGWPWDLLVIGDAFRDKGDYARARSYYERTGIPAKDATFAVSVSDLELRQNAVERAWAALQPALAEHPGDPDLLAQAAVVRRRAGGPDALDLAARALESRLDAKTVARLDAAFERDRAYTERKRAVVDRVEGLFSLYERKYDFQYLRRDDATAEWAIGQIGATYKDHEALPLLVRYLAESSFPETRAKAADALWYIGDRRAVPALLQALSDPDLKVQGFAASGLGELGDPAAVAPLLDLFARLPDNRQETKARIADALGKLGDPRALAPIRESLAQIKDPAYVRWAQPAATRLAAGARRSPARPPR